MPRAALLLASLPLLLAGCGGDEGDRLVAPVAILPVSAEQLDSVATRLAPLGGHPIFSALLVGGDDGLPWDFSDPFVPPAVRGDRGVPAPSGRPVADHASLFAIPDSLRGLTFVVDTAAFPFAWRVDRLADGTPRPGAPTGGVRVQLVNDEFGDHVVVGHLDLLPAGSASAPQLAVEAFDTAGQLVLRFAATGLGTGSGFARVGSARVDQVVTRGSTGKRSRFTGQDGLALDATRDWNYSRSSLGYVNAIRVAGHALDVRTTTGSMGGPDALSFTYTVFVDGAPFARLRTTLTDTPTWRHLAEDRALTDDEARQVRALLRALRNLPEPSNAWDEALFFLLWIQAPDR